MIITALHSCRIHQHSQASLGLPRVFYSWAGTKGHWCPDGRGAVVEKGHWPICQVYSLTKSFLWEIFFLNIIFLLVNIFFLAAHKGTFNLLTTVTAWFGLLVKSFTKNTILEGRVWVNPQEQGGCPHCCPAWAGLWAGSVVTSGLRSRAECGDPALSGGPNLGSFFFTKLEALFL